MFPDVIIDYWYEESGMGFVVEKSTLQVNQYTLKRLISKNTGLMMKISNNMVILKVIMTVKR